MNFEIDVAVRTISYIPFLSGSCKCQACEVFLNLEDGRLNVITLAWIFFNVDFCLKKTLGIE